MVTRLVASCLCSRRCMLTDKQKQLSQWIGRSLPGIPCTLHPPSTLLAPSQHPVSTRHPVNAYCTTTMRAASHCAIACCYSELCVQCTHLLPLPPPTVLQLLLLLPQRFQVSSVSSESLFTVVAIVFAVIIIAVASVLLLPHLLLLLLTSLLRPLLLMLLNIAWPVLAYPQCRRRRPAARQLVKRSSAVANSFWTPLQTLVQLPQPLSRDPSPPALPLLHWLCCFQALKNGTKQDEGHRCGNGNVICSLVHLQKPSLALSFSPSLTLPLPFSLPLTVSKPFQSICCSDALAFWSFSAGITIIYYMHYIASARMAWEISRGSIGSRNHDLGGRISTPKQNLCLP